MSESLSNISLKKLALMIADSLSDYGVNAILTGGSCVTIYSNDKYVSKDLDFVADDIYFKKIKSAMQDIGFVFSQGKDFRHPDCMYSVEFIPAPLSVGSEPVKDTRNIRSKRGSLVLLSPTDCVKDRLAAYFHWDDLQSLEQAIMVSKKQKINFSELKRWAKVENNSEKYDKFLKMLKRST